MTEIYSLPAVSLDRGVTATFGEATERAELGHRAISGGAGHDAMLLARHVPTGMLFVPSIGGISHAPGELTLDADVENGVAVLTAAIGRLVR